MDPASSPESRNSPLSGLTRHHAPSKEEPISKNVLHREKAMGSMRVCESDPRWAFHLEKLALALPLAGYSLISLLKMSPNPRYWDRSFAAHAGRFFEVPAKWPQEKMSRDWIKACEIAALLTTTSDHLARISQLGTGNSVGVELTDTADKAKRLSQNTLGFATLLSTANWSRYESYKAARASFDELLLGVYAELKSIEDFLQLHGVRAPNGKPLVPALEEYLPLRDRLWRWLKRAGTPSERA